MYGLGAVSSMDSKNEVLNSSVSELKVSLRKTKKFFCGKFLLEKNLSENFFA